MQGSGDRGARYSPARGRIPEPIYNVYVGYTLERRNLPATLTDAGLDWIGKVALGIIPGEGLLVLLCNDASSLGTAMTFGDAVPSTLPGATIQPIVPASWFDGSGPGAGDFAYPLLTWTFTASPSGETLVGYVVYSGVSNTVIWFDTFDIPQDVPPTGGVAYLNLELTTQNA